MISDCLFHVITRGLLLCCNGEDEDKGYRIPPPSFIFIKEKFNDQNFQTYFN